MDNNRITNMDGSKPQKQASFQETMILNLERQKAIVEQNIAFYQSKLPIFDEAITACKENKELSEFAELMHNLQQGMQHAPPQQ